MLGKPSRRTRKKLEQEGRSAPATVLAISERGMAVTNGSEGLVSNTEVILKTRLRVEPVGEPAFEVEERFRYPQLSIPSVGSRLTVLYDPDDHDRLMIDRSRPAGVVASEIFASAPSGPMDLSGLLETVKAARDQAGGDRQAMAEALRGALGASGATVIGPEAFAPAQDPIEHLKKLAALRDEGVLTQAEFDEQKARLLAAGL